MRLELKPPDQAMHQIRPMVKDRIPHFKLRHGLHEYMDHYHHERNHQGTDNVLLFPTISQDTVRAGPLQCREQLGGLLGP